VWQTLYAELKGRNFTILAVAMDSRADAARPWIEAARPEYPVLIDRVHLVAELYNMVNVPQAVWIDEAGRIVRPTENAGAFEGFRAMDRATRALAPEIAAKVANAKATYVAAVRDWVDKGAASAHVFDPANARAHVPRMDDAIAAAHASFRFGQHLLQMGRAAEAQVFLDEARRLHPQSWNIWRQLAEPNETGLAAGPEFWARVDALGERHYYPPVDMQGMPSEAPPSRRG
jgi:hypothetical protein